jgi:Ca-activated chloride channel family protein
MCLTALTYFALGSLFRCDSALVRELAIREEVRSWSTAISLAEAELQRPVSDQCRAYLVQHVYTDVIEWGRDLRTTDIREARQKVDVCSQMTQTYPYLDPAPCKLLQIELQPPPLAPTATPAPIPTKQVVFGVVRILGVDRTYFPRIAAQVSVVDLAGRPVTGLTKWDFGVFDDRKPVQDVTITAFDLEPPAICAALAVDVSGSMAGAPLEGAKRGAQTFLDQLTDRDQVMVVAFSTTAEIVQPWTSDRQQASHEVRTLGAGTNTALWDALWTAAIELQKCQGRRALVLLTDGQDSKSQFHSREAAVEQVRQSGTGLYVLGLRGSDYNPGAMQSLVKDAGGLYRETADPNEFARFYQETAGTIQKAYLVEFRVDRSAPDSSAHTLRVDVGASPVWAEQTYRDR